MKEKYDSVRNRKDSFAMIVQASNLPVENDQLPRKLH